MCNEKTCETCHGSGKIITDGAELFPWLGKGEMVLTRPCPECYAPEETGNMSLKGKPMDPAEERKVKREFERVPDKFVSRE